MNFQISGLVLFNLISCILGYAVAAILWRYPKGGNHNNRLLSASFFFLSFAQTVGILVETGAILNVPHFYRLGNLCGLLFMPLSWMYMRGLLMNKKFHWIDVIHFVPALLYFVDYSHIFFASAEVKRQAILNSAQNLNDVLKYRDSRFFPGWFHLGFRNVLILIYWVLELQLLIKVLRAKSKEIISENKAWFRWLSTYVFLQFFICAPFFPTVLLGVNIPFWNLITFGASIVLTFTAISLIFQPVILYGIRGWIISHEGLDPQPSQQSGHMMYIGKEKLKTINNMLNTLMIEQKPYLKAGYSLLDLTNDLGVPLYQVSFFLNHEKGKNFHDMLNEYRVEYSQEIMQVENNRQLTLEAIAFESGFGNRNSFTNAFKKFTGSTPSSFMKDIRQNRTSTKTVKVIEDEKGKFTNGHKNGNGNGSGSINGIKNGNGKSTKQK